MFPPNHGMPSFPTLNREILQKPVPLPQAPTNPLHSALFHMLGLHAQQVQENEKTIVAEYTPIPAVKTAPISIPASRTMPAPRAAPATSTERVRIEPFLARMNAGSLRFPALQQSRRAKTKILPANEGFKPTAAAFKINYSFRDTKPLATIRTGHVHRFVAPRERENPDIRTALMLLDTGLHAHQLPMRMGTKKAAHALRTIRAAANRKEWHAARHAR